MNYPITPGHIGKPTFNQFCSVLGVRHQDFYSYLIIFWIVKLSQLWYEKEAARIFGQDNFVDRAECPYLPPYQPCDIGTQKALGWPWPTFRQSNLQAFINWTREKYKKDLMRKKEPEVGLAELFYLTEQHLGKNLDKIDLAKFNQLATIVKPNEQTKEEQDKNLIWSPPDFSHWLDHLVADWYCPNHNFATFCFKIIPSNNCLP